MTTETKVRPFREWVKENGVWKLRVNLHPGQMEAYNSEAKNTLLFWAPQSGKTCFGPVWLQKQIAKYGRIDGNGDYLAISATFGMFQLKMLPELLKQFVGGRFADGSSYEKYIGRYWAGNKVIELAENLEAEKFWAKNKDDEMWGRIILRSADAEGGMESSTANAVWADELGEKEFTLPAWEALNRRLIISQGPVLGTTTLYKYGHWLKTKVWDSWLAGNEEYRVIHCNPLDNPAYPEVELERARRELPAWKYKLLYEGQFEKPAGLIYDSFNESVCKIKRFPIPKEWLIYTGHDFGGSNPAAMFYAEKPSTGDLFAFHEYKPGQGKSPGEHIEQWQRITQGMRVMRSAGGSHQEWELRQLYSMAGWPMQDPRLRSVEAQISKVYALHSANKVYVFDDLEAYLDEKLSYTRELDDDYESTDKIAQKSKFHLMDAERGILCDFDSDANYADKPTYMKY